MSNASVIAQVRFFGNSFGVVLIAAITLALATGIALAAPGPRGRTGPTRSTTQHRSSMRRSLTLHQLRLIDDAGKTRLLLSTDNGEPTITMLDSQGHVLLAAFLDSRGYGSVQLVNPVDGHPHAAFALDDKGAHVKFDRDGGASSYIFLNNAGESGAVFLDTQGKRRLNLLVKTSGEPTIERFDGSGKPYP